jgi:hypothetical protein
VAGIFISYRRQDSQGFAGRLADDLIEAFGEHRVFRDVEIRPGDDFTYALREAVAGCDVLLAVISRGWLHARTLSGHRRLFQSNDWVRVEIETALDRGIRVVPVLVGGATMPGADNLPPSLAALAARQAFVLRDDRWAGDITRLSETLVDSVGPIARTDHTDHAETPAQVMRDLGERVLSEVRRSRGGAFSHSGARSAPAGIWIGVMSRLGALVRQALGITIALGIGYYLIQQFGDPSSKRFLDQLIQPVLAWFGPG